MNEVIGVNGGDLSVWGELGESGEYDELSPRKSAKKGSQKKCKKKFSHSFKY